MSRCLQVSRLYSRIFFTHLLLIVGVVTIFSSFLTSSVSAQTFFNPSDTDPQYDARKLGTASNQARLNAAPRSARAIAQVARPSCFEPYDTTAGGGWTQIPRNDDGSVGPVSLGWNFSLFGTVYNRVYINNNGNITFDAPLSEYTPGGFPIAIPMVAAFWADVDTRNTNSGSAWYKLYPDRLVVTWNYVGYYSQKADKKNTFQLVIKANTAPGFTGNDVLFSYDDMQWTTGDVSGGSNGFGGSAATVGVNRGNSVDYIQTGRFNLDNSNPPNVPTTGTPGGVSWLDGQCLGYQVRGVGGNVPPAVAGLPSAITVTQGETRTIPFQFSGPEVNQNVNITYNLNGLCNATVNTTSNNTPNPNTVFSVTGGICNGGTTNVTFTALDNGSPAASQTFTMQVTVLAPPIVANPIPNQVGIVGRPFNFTIPANTFTDPNGDPFTVSVSGLPTGLNFSNGVISGTPQNQGVSTVTVTATDPGSLSVSTTFTITINPNQAPVVANAIPNQVGTVGQPFNFIIPTNTFSDPDGDALTISVSGLPAGLNFSNGVISGTPQSQTVSTVTVTATDPGNLSVSTTFTITINPVPVQNQAPTVANMIPNQVGTVGQAFNFTIPANTFADPNGDALTVSVSGLPDGLNFSNGVISGTPQNQGVSTVTVTATDPGNLSVSTTFTITINPVPVQNLAPTVVNNIPNQVGTVGQPFNFTIPTNTFSDPNGDALTVSVSGLPAGLNFSNGVISGTPQSQTVATVTVTATDPGNLSVSTTFTITINPVPAQNQAPVVANAIPNQVGTVGQPFNFTIPTNTFSDPNGDALTVSVSGLPAGLNFSNGVISGTPQNQGPSTITVTATDPGSLSVSTTFIITINPAGSPQTFALVAPTYNCQTGQFTFNTVGGDGTTIEYYAVPGITGWTTNPNQFVDFEMRTAADAPALTLRARQSGIEVTYVWNIRQVCPVSTPNAPVVANTIPNQVGTVGQPFNFTIPANTFSDPNGDALTVSVSGLPTGLNFSNGVISGTPQNQGVSTVTVTATDPGNLSVSTTFTITINPANSPQPFALVAPTYNCQTGQFTFNTVGGDGTTIEYYAVPGITGWTTNPNQFVDIEMRTAPDAPALTLRARQSGIEVTYVWSIRAVCPVGRPGDPIYADQAPGVRIPILNQVATQNQFFSYTFPEDTFGDPDGDPMTYSASGLPEGMSLSGRTISGTPLHSGAFTVSITAFDPTGLSATSTFTLFVNPAGGNFAITNVTTINCAVISATERLITFNPQYGGTNGQMVTFYAVNESSPTTAPGPYSLRLYTDNPVITLKAQQAGSNGEASYVYHWMAACTNSNTRQAAISADEPIAVLKATTYPNPVNDEFVLSIKGAQGQAVRLSLTDISGRPEKEMTIDVKTPEHEERIRMSQASSGLYLLRVSTATQVVNLKVIKQ